MTIISGLISLLTKLASVAGFILLVIKGHPIAGFILLITVFPANITYTRKQSSSEGGIKQCQKE